MESDLSPRALRYLGLNSRKQDIVCSRDDLVAYFQRHHIPLNEHWIDFQAGFSGFELVIPSFSSDDKVKNTSNPGSIISFFSRLFSRKKQPKAYVKDKFTFVSISKNELDNAGFLAGYESLCDGWFPFGYGMAPFNFAMNPQGEIAAYYESVIEKETRFVSSSVAKFIENFAMRDELFHLVERSQLFENPGYHCLVDIEGLEEILHKQEFFPVDECSDRYRKWYKNNSLTVYQGEFLGGVGLFLHVYARTEKIASEFIEILKHKEILKPGHPEMN